MRLALRLLVACLVFLPLSAAAQIETNFWNGGGVRVGISTTTCDTTVRGSMRFNDTSKEIELCNGTAWARLVGTVTSGPVAPPGSGYFVLTASTWDGDLGGQTGADAKCLAELTGNTNWKYYVAADGDGQLVAGNVKAFVCDNNTACSGGLTPLTTYYFARVGNSDAGGASFTTDASGIGPNDSNNWAAANFFSGTYTYWTNRAAGTATAWGANGAVAGNNGLSCAGLASSASGSSSMRIGISASTDSGRWNVHFRSCAGTNSLICFVNP